MEEGRGERRSVSLSLLALHKGTKKCFKSKKVLPSDCRTNCSNKDFT